MSEHDQKLKAFLKTNQPVAPQAPRDELEVLIQKLDLKTKRRAWLEPWITGISAVAAGVAAFVFVTQSGVVPKKFVADTAVEAAVEDMSFDLDEIESVTETSEVGEEYLAFITD